MYSVLHLGLSYSCNMRCRHCFVNRQTDRITLSQITQIIDELCKHGLLMVYYTYGEPLLAKQLFDVASYAKSLDLIQILMTNAYIINDAYIEKIKGSGINTIYVSIDSALESKHDCNRGVDGAFARALIGIQKMKDAGLSVGISTAVTKDNVEELHEIYDLALRLGVGVISFLRARINQSVVCFSAEQKDKYFDFVKFGIKQQEINVKFHDFELLPQLKLWLNDGTITLMEYEKYYGMNCCHAHSTISVSPDGLVGNCNLMKNLLGDINSTCIQEILGRGSCDENIICCSTVPQ